MGVCHHLPLFRAALLFGAGALMFSTWCLAEPTLERHELHHAVHNEIAIVSVSPSLSLSKVLDVAVQHAPEASEQTAFERSARAISSQSSGWLPDAPSIGLQYQTDALHDDLGYAETDARIDFPLWRRGEKGALKQLSEQATRFAADYGEVLRLTVAGRLRRSLWELQAARSTLELARESLVTAEKLDAKISRMVELGARPRTDQLLSRQDVLKRQRDVLDAEATLRAESLHYGHLTEMGQMPAHIEEQAGQGGLPEKHPALARLALELAQAKSDLQRARYSGGDAPSISVNWRQEEAASSLEKQMSAGIGVRLPLGASHYAAPAVAEARQRITRLSSELHFQHHRLEAALDRGRMELRALDKALTLATEQLTTAEQQHRLAKRAYENGEMGILGLLQSQTAWLEARRAVADTRIKRGETIANINQALGVTP